MRPREREQQARDYCWPKFPCEARRARSLCEVSRVDRRIAKRVREGLLFRSSFVCTEYGFEVFRLARQGFVSVPS